MGVPELIHDYSLYILVVIKSWFSTGMPPTITVRIAPALTPPYIT